MPREAQFDDAGLSFFDLLLILARRWWVVLGAAALITLGIAVPFANQAPEYVYAGTVELASYKTREQAGDSPWSRKPVEAAERVRARLPDIVEQADAATVPISAAVTGPRELRVSANGTQSREAEIRNSLDRVAAALVDSQRGALDAFSASADKEQSFTRSQLASAEESRDSLLRGIAALDQTAQIALATSIAPVLTETERRIAGLRSDLATAGLVATSIEPGSVHPATRVAGPLGFPLGVIVAAALVGGLIVGVVLALFWEGLDRAAKRARGHAQA